MTYKKIFSEPNMTFLKILRYCLIRLRQFSISSPKTRIRLYAYLLIFSKENFKISKFIGILFFYDRRECSTSRIGAWHLARKTDLPKKTTDRFFKIKRFRHQQITLILRPRNGERQIPVVCAKCVRAGQFGFWSVVTAAKTYDIPHATASDFSDSRMGGCQI